MPTSPAKLEGQGTITRKDGTVVQFTLTQELTEEQAASLNLEETGDTISIEDLTKVKQLEK